jgi:hypothetical protein
LNKYAASILTAKVAMLTNKPKKVTKGKVFCRTQNTNPGSMKPFLCMKYITGKGI